MHYGILDWLARTFRWSKWKFLKWLKLSQNVPETILVGQCDHFNHWLLMKISTKMTLNMGCFDAFFSKWLIYYENVSDRKSFKASYGWTVGSGRLKTSQIIENTLKINSELVLRWAEAGHFFAALWKTIFFRQRRLAAILTRFIFSVKE